jgi:membrane associated rhomboid family serine protease
MYERIPIWTCLIIAATCVSSIVVFRNRALEERFIFRPEGILAWKEYYRLVTGAFLHADFQHLAMNMLTLFLFGRTVEWRAGPLALLLIYFGAIIGGSLLSLYVHRHHDYRAYGASGGVCGVVFAYILLFPGSSINPYFIPIAVPGWLYAIGYLLYSFYGMKQHRDDVGHDAHLGGAIIGLLIAAILNPSAIQYNLRGFLAVLIPAVGLLVYLWLNPMFLPLASFFDRATRPWGRRTARPAPKREELRVDAILDKISKQGVGSLSPEERSLLDQTSSKYRRRAESEKPESGLTF